MITTWINSLEDYMGNMLKWEMCCEFWIFIYDAHKMEIQFWHTMGSLYLLHAE
jgi:hypothetical protein